jgi:MFS family permease
VLGLVMPTWEAELGWSRSFVSGVAALMMIVVAAAAPVAGNMLDRLGARALLTGGLLVLALGLGITALAVERWQFLVGFAVFVAAGLGIVAVHLVGTIVAFHFDENRGLATGIATAGSTAGQLLIVPVLAVLLEASGWRLPFGTLALGALALAPFAWLVIRARSRTVQRTATPEPLAQRLAFLVRNPVFHALFWSFFICGFTTTGVIETHLIPYTIACGFPPLQGATAYGVLAAFNMMGMVGAGYLSDRVNRPLLLGVIYIGRALSFLLLMRITDDLPMLMIFAVAFGIFDFSTFPITASLVASHMGLRIMGLTMGLVSAGHAVGAALGAFLGGWLYDAFAKYDFVWAASVATALVAGVLAFTIRENRATPRLAPA